MAKSKGWTLIQDGTMVQWEDQKSKPIEGKLTSVSVAKSKAKVKKGEKAKTYKIFKIETKTGLLAVSGSQLEKKLEGIKIGKEVRIIFTGKKKTGSGYKVNTFEVATR